MTCRLEATTRALPRGKALVGLFALLLMFNLFLFPARSARLRALSGGAGPVLDVRFGYTPDEISAYADALGPDGRRLYAITQVTLDLAYPALYSLMLSGLLAFVLARGIPVRYGIAWLALIPFGMALFDLAENLSIVGLLLFFPVTPPWLAHLASTFTVDKWLAGGVVLGVLAAALVAWAIRAVRGDSATKT